MLCGALLQLYCMMSLYSDLLQGSLIGGALIFGTVLESCQGAWMPGRFADWGDVVADGVGAGLALGAFQLIFGRRPGRIASD